MPKRESIESRIINYFREEELSKANLVFGLVKGEMTKRQPKKRRPSKPRTITVEQRVQEARDETDIGD